MFLFKYNFQVVHISTSFLDPYELLFLLFPTVLKFDGKILSNNGPSFPMSNTSAVIAMFIAQTKGGETGGGGKVVNETL